MPFDVFTDIRDMHKYYGIEVPHVPQLMGEDHAVFRLKFLQEELTEFAEALLRGDLPGQVDALIDLMVVASGTLDFLGVDGRVHWDEVHRANMEKEPVKSAAESKRGSAVDLKKPEGWVAPDHDGYLIAAGWRPNE